MTLIIEKQFYLFAFFIVVSSSAQFDDLTYKDGERQFGIMEKRSKLPKYGKCWTSAISYTMEACRELTDVVQTRLALAYLNCFLAIQGRAAYDCKIGQVVSDCLRDISDSDRSSLTTFFTHANSICYFLQSQVWQELTQNTITRLSDTSTGVADQMVEIMQHQNTTINNQKVLLNQANNLSAVLTNSSNSLSKMFDEFNRTSTEQHNLLMSVFSQISKAQNLVIGEFLDFYSLIFYIMTILLSYFLTSTKRTGNARFWMFAIMTLNIIAEKVIIVYSREYSDSDYATHGWRWLCRQISCLLGFLTLIISALRYRDISEINNHLLVTIQKQNSDILNMLSAYSPEAASRSSRSTRSHSQYRNYHPSNCPNDDSVGYYSESDSESDRYSSSTDHTFVPGDFNRISDSESFVAESLTSSRSSTPSIVEELSALRETTPFKEIAAFLNKGDKDNVDVSSEPTQVSTNEIRGRYNLRSRINQVRHNPILERESVKEFTRVVRR